MDWYEITDRYDDLAMAAEGDLTAIPHEWQRELAAIARLEGDVNNGGYLQFIQNSGILYYVTALRGLRKIGARKMARILEKCQQLVADHTDAALDDATRYQHLMPNPIIRDDGTMTTPSPSPIPEAALQRIYDLSDEFMDYPDDIPSLGTAYYAKLVETDRE